jgi:hypothetical protein
LPIDFTVDTRFGQGTCRKISVKRDDNARGVDGNSAQWLGWGYEERTGIDPRADMTIGMGEAMSRHRSCRHAHRPRGIMRHGRKQTLA